MIGKRGSLPSCRLDTARGGPVTCADAVLVIDNKPAAVVVRLAAELQKIQATPEFRDQLTRFGMEPFAPQSPEQFAAMIVAEQPRWAQAIKESGAKVD